MENEIEIVDVQEYYDDVAYAVDEHDSVVYFTDLADAQAYRDYLVMINED